MSVPHDPFRGYVLDRRAVMRVDAPQDPPKPKLAATEPETKPRKTRRPKKG